MNKGRVKIRLKNKEVQRKAQRMIEATGKVRRGQRARARALILFHSLFTRKGRGRRRRRKPTFQDHPRRGSDRSGRRKSNKEPKKD